MPPLRVLQAGFQHESDFDYGARCDDSQCLLLDGGDHDSELLYPSAQRVTWNAPSRSPTRQPDP